MKKKLLLSLLLAVFSSVAVFAYSYVFDEAGILSTQEKENLNSQIQTVVDNHDGELGIYVAAVASYEDYGAYNVEEFGEYFYNANRLGKGNNKTGLLLVLSMNEREYDVCAYGDFSHTTFTDYGKEKLADAALSYFRSNNWYGGFSAYVSKADKMITMSDNGNPLDAGTMYFDSHVLLVSIFAACLIGLVIGLLVAIVLRGKMNNVKSAKSANNYVEQDDVKITNRTEQFLHNVVTRTPISQNDNRGGGGGRPGGTSINSGGFSHSSGRF